VIEIVKSGLIVNTSKSNFSNFVTVNRLQFSRQKYKQEKYTKWTSVWKP